MENKDVPHSDEAEGGVLGLLLYNNDLYFEVCQNLKPEHFYNIDAGLIYSTIKTLLDQGRTADPITVKQTIIGTRQGKAIDDLSELLAVLLDNRIMAPSALSDYVKLVIDLSISRSMIAEAEEATRAARANEVHNSEEFVGGLIERLDGLIDTTDEAKTEDCEDIAERVMHRFENGAPPAVCDTGLVDIDNLLGGLREAWQVVLAGRPGMGKSILGGQIACNVSQKGGGVIFVSLEMSNDQMGDRSVISLAAQEYGVYNVPACNDMYKPHIDPAHRERLRAATERFSRLPIIWESGTELTMSNIRMKINRSVRKLKAKGADLKLIVIDHMGLISAGNKRGSKYEEISDISNGIKAVAKQYNIPVLSLCQLSRKVEDRADKRPILADLRDSGHIEQDADVVMFVYRPAYYAARQSTDGMTPDEALKISDQIDSKDLFVDVAKNRHGPTGEAHLWCEVDRMYVTNGSPDFRRAA